MASAKHGIVIGRRTLLLGAGTSGIAALVGCGATDAAPPARSTRLIAGTLCPATPRQTEGPFYFDPELVRQDLAEGKAGAPFRLRLQIVGAADCAPADRARVDIWHCDAGGAYSGYDRERTQGARWLRGTQFADSNGVVTFRTLYPGWYEGRAPHIHVKAWLHGRGGELTSQIYFPEALSDRIYAGSDYAGRAGRRMRNEDDFIFRRAGEAVPIVQAAETPRGYDGAIVIALS